MDSLLNSSSLTVDESKQQQKALQQSKFDQPSSVFIWTAILLLTVPLAYYGYLSCQLLRTTNEQQLQLELLHRRVENLTAFVNGVVVSTTNDHPKRVKRQNSVHSQHQHHHHHQHQQRQSVQIGQEFRWIEPNWTEEESQIVEKSSHDYNSDEKSESTKRHHSRRQVEMIPDTDVHFFSSPRPPPNSAHRSAGSNPGDSNYEWLSSYSRVSVSGHMHAYYLPQPTSILSIYIRRKYSNFTWQPPPLFDRQMNAQCTVNSEHTYFSRALSSTNVSIC